MDVLKYLTEGNVYRNPEYNPKTKKGAVVPPYLVDNTPNNDALSKKLEVTRNTMARNLGIIEEDPTEYAPYDVYVNTLNTTEELNKERAKNQSEFAQGVYAIGQTLNEITTGTVLGAADLASIIVDAMDGELSYERPDVIQSLANFKEAINEQMPIYRENPEKAFDVTDFAWWASNTPSIASSLTLMVPGVGVSKGLSYIGKVSRLNKLGNKAANILKLSEKTREIAAKGIEATKTGLTMRMLENYQEAERTRQDAYDYALSELKLMDDKKRAEFYKNNPDYIDKTDEEIAKDIAKNAADTTFDFNIWNSIFDIAQVYGLKNMWGKTLQGSNTQRLKKLNRAAAAKFGDEASAIQEAIAKQTFKDKTIDKIKDISSDVAHGIRYEWTEGIEEAINYIGTEKGMEMAKLAFDKNTDVKTIQDYLKDPHLWESAFWGVVGGVVFSGASDAVGGFVQRKLNKDWNNAEQQKEQEIYNRQLHFQHYQDAINKIAKGKNPYINIYDEITKEQIEADIINDTEKEQLLNLARDVYFDGMITDAIDNGNYELLEAFARDENVTKGFKEKLNLSDAEALELQQQFINRMETTKNTYLDVFNRVNAVGGDFNIGRIIARQLVDETNRKKLNDTLKNYNDNLYNQVLNNDNVNISQEELSAIEKLVYRNRIRNIENQIFNINSDASKTKKQKERLIKELENQKKQLEEFQPLNLYDENGIINDKEIYNLANRVKTNYSNEFNTIYAKYNNDLNYKLNQNSVDITEPTLRKRVKELKNIFDESKQKIISNAIKTQNDLYRKYRNNFDVNNMSKKDADAYNTTLKILQDAEYDLNDLNLQREIIDAQEERKVAYEEVAPKEDDVPELEDADVSLPTGKPDDTVTNITNTSNTPITAETAATPEIDITSSPVESEAVTKEPTQPVVEPSVESTTQPPSINPAEMDFIERDKYIEDYINDALMDATENQSDDDVDYVATLDNIKSTVIADLQNQGLNVEEVNKKYDIVRGMYSGDLSAFGDNGQLFSLIPETDRKLLINATLAITKRKPTAKQKHIIAILEEYANITDDTGNTFGRTIGDKIYLSVENLISYIYDGYGSHRIADYLFNDIKSFINSKANDTFVLTDDKSILNLTAEQFSNRIKTFTTKKRELIQQYIPNNVNINDAEYSTITNLNLNDELNYKVDKGIGRILLYKGDTFVGYLGIPQVNGNGTFITTNRGWNYDITINENGTADSRLKEFFKEIFAAKDPQLAADLYAYSFNNANDEETIDRIYNALINLENGNYFFKSLPDDPIDILTAKEGIVSHIATVLAKAVIDGNNNIANSIDNWFNKLAYSYAQTHSIANGDVTGKFTVAKLHKGEIITDDDNLNSISEVIPNYNENTHPLATIIDRNTIQYANSTQPIYSNRFSQIGVTMLAIPRETGVVTYARCYQVKIKDLPSNNFGKQLSEAIKKELQSIITEFISNDKYEFTNFKNDVTALVNKNGLVTGFDAIVGKNQNSIGFKLSTEKQSYLFTVYNNPTGRFLQINNLSDEKYRRNDKVFGANKNNVNDNIIQDFIKNNINTLFENAQFAIPFDKINDSKKIPVSNKYYKKENGKTIISVGNVSKEFNSYQDFLVSNNLIVTNVNNLGNNPEKGISGIYKKDGLVTLDVVFKDDTTSWVDNIISLADTVDVKRITQRLSVDKTSDVLKEIFYNNQEALKFVNDLQRLGVLPEAVYLDDTFKDTEQQPIFAYYDKNTNSIGLNINRINNLSYNRFIRTMVHESLHQQLNNVYNRETALQKIEIIYNKYKQYVEELETKEPNNEDLPYLKQFIDITDNKETSLEEFLVESLTNKDLMEALNKIPSSYKTRMGKVKSLFQELLEVIADILGIKINKDSLLGEELTLLKGINKINKKTSKRKIKSNVAVQTTLNFEEETKINDYEKEIKEEIKTNEVNDMTEEEINDVDDYGLDYSSISERTNSNLSNIVRNISPALQPSMSQMLTDGDISIYCM